MSLQLVRPERRGVEVFRNGLVADLALGLEAAEFGGGSLKVAQGLGAGTVDRVLRIALNFDRGFGFGAAAQAPGGMNDLGGEGGFHGAFGSEVPLEAFAENLIDVFFFGANDVAGGIDAEDGGVAGHARFAFDGPGPVEDWALRRLAAIWASVAIGFDLSPRSA